MAHLVRSACPRFFPVTAGCCTGRQEAWDSGRPAGPHVLAAQQQGLPARTELAGQPRILRLFAEAASSRASLTELRTALRGTL
jgi:hypothetical protein